MLLEHTAGLPYLNDPLSLRDIGQNTQSVAKSIHSQKPIWHPGTKHGYHDWTYGIILDRLLHKVDPEGRHVPQIFKEEIADPYGIEFDMNLKREDVHKAARIHTQSFTQILWQLLTNMSYLKMYLKSVMQYPDATTFKTFNTVKENTMPLTIFNDPEMREIAISSMSGTGTARGLAKLFSILANNGKYNGKSVLSNEVIKRMMNSPSGDTCSVTGLPMKFSLGMQVFSNPSAESTFGHAGYGGQIVVADPVNKLSIAYLTSYLSIYRNGDDPRFLELQKAVYKSLDKYIARKKRMI